jgi:hypothetical protein
MTTLNWESFTALPGSPSANFELVCRAAIRGCYGQFGEFHALSQNPGVEFSLCIKAESPLGNAGRCFGWQCKWYDLPSGRSLGSARRADIASSLQTSQQRLPVLTDWVLWTRRALTKADQHWLASLQTQIQIHQYTAEDLEAMLGGPLTNLRETFFGELVLKPEEMAMAHEASVAKVRGRWIPEVHQRSLAEREIRRALGDRESWSGAMRTARAILLEAKELESGVGTLAPTLTFAIKSLLRDAKTVANTLRGTVAEFIDGDIERLSSSLKAQPVFELRRHGQLPRALRKLRHPASMVAANLLDSCARAEAMIAYARKVLDLRVVALVAGAGCGKTQLAAHLTAPQHGGIGGVLLHGRELPAKGGLDAFARTVPFPGRQMTGFEDLLAAVDAAGKRAKRRIPIVIDGLNESEDPRDWHGHLAELAVSLRRYDNVIVICLVRPRFRRDCVPANVRRMRMDGFDVNLRSAIMAYFSHYKIDHTDAEIDPEMFSHPLTLRFFCEVTNHRRESTVGVEAMPLSLASLFERYLSDVAQRVALHSPASNRYHAQDVKAALQRIGELLWDRRERSIERQLLRMELGDASRNWISSLVWSLENEGLLLQTKGVHTDGVRVALAYDRLAGHVIADSCLRRAGRSQLRSWIADLGIGKSGDAAHPLSEDVIAALAGLVPARFAGEQLWRLVDEPVKERALLAAIAVEPRHIDGPTVAEISSLLSAPSQAQDMVLAGLRRTRGILDHPLNSSYLDAQLRQMPVAARDLGWTEWVRRSDKFLRQDVARLTNRWRSRKQRGPADLLRARWAMWLLSTTVRPLRDEATRALYWYGRGDPEGLFDLALSSLTQNDGYISERTIAAAYGVTLAQQLQSDAFARALAPFLSGLVSALSAGAASSPSDHWLLREYVCGIFLFAERFYSAALPSSPLLNQASFALAGVPVGPTEDDARNEVSETIRMDFRNYTIGGLVADRRNYEMEHAGLRQALRHVEDTVWHLGWRRGAFEPVESRLGDWREGRSRRRVERYGKKYGWLGYFTYAGRLASDGAEIDGGERLSDVDLDPSFPEPPPPLAFPLNPNSWLSGDDERQWLSSWQCAIPKALLRLREIDGYPGPWLAVYADLEARANGRRAFARVMALIVPSHSEDSVMIALRKGARWDPNSAYDVPQDFYTFAGEIPWHPVFAGRDGSEGAAGRYGSLLSVGSGRKVLGQVLAHFYAWEQHHSEANQAGTVPVPSRLLSDQFDLRAIGNCFRQVLPDGEPASIPLIAPKGFEGELLYVREDLVRAFVGDRSLIWSTVGERNVELVAYQPPAWALDVLREGANRFGEAIRFTDLLQSDEASGRAAK